MNWLPAMGMAILLCGQACAQDVSRLYPPSELERSADLYGRNLHGMWEEDFLSRLTQDERRRAGAVALYLPRVGSNRHPLDFYADPMGKRVFLPIASVRFVDDIAIAFAWYGSKGCDIGLVSDYAALLRFRPGALNEPPLRTLGVPSDALGDEVVDDVSQKILKSIVFFVAAHEYAHVMYGHASYGSITAAQAQAQEEQADAFALDVMQRIGVAPLGMTFFFQIVTRLEPSPIEFQSTKAYEEYLRSKSTHPVSASRIEAMASGIEKGIDSFARLQPAPAAYRRNLLVTVSQLREIARTLNDRDMRSFMAERARTTDVARLRSACAGN